MTPEQSRIKTKLTNLARENLHRNCEVKIKQTGPHWGLYCNNAKCKKTGQWISWIKQDAYKSILKKDDKYKTQGEKTNGKTQLL